MVWHQYRQQSISDSQFLLGNVEILKSLLLIHSTIMISFFPLHFSAGRVIPPLLTCTSSPSFILLKRFAMIPGLSRTTNRTVLSELESASSGVYSRGTVKSGCVNVICVISLLFSRWWEDGGRVNCIRRYAFGRLMEEMSVALFFCGVGGRVK